MASVKAYRSLRLTRGGAFIMSAQAHTEFVDAFYRISQDRANKIVILTGAGGEFIVDVDWSSFGDVSDPGVWSQAWLADCGGRILCRFRRRRLV